MQNIVDKWVDSNRIFLNNARSASSRVGKTILQLSVVVAPGTRWRSLCEVLRLCNFPYRELSRFCWSISLQRTVRRSLAVSDWPVLHFDRPAAEGQAGPDEEISAAAGHRDIASILTDQRSVWSARSRTCCHRLHPGIFFYVVRMPVRRKFDLR